MSTESRSILSALVVIAIIVGGVYWWKQKASDPSAQNISRDKVEVTDLSAATGNERVPSGFPTGLPLETENVTESISQNYVERGVVLSSYTYITEKSREEVLQSYRDYFSSNGFTLGEDRESGGAHFLRGRKFGDDVLIIASAKDGMTQVQLAYTDRQ